jgi:WD repeat-containing protein 23
MEWVPSDDEFGGGEPVDWDARDERFNAQGGGWRTADEGEEAHEDQEGNGEGDDDDEDDPDYRDEPDEDDEFHGN